MTRDLTAAALALVSAVALLATAPTSQARLEPAAATSLSASASTALVEAPQLVRRGAAVAAPTVPASAPLGVPVPAWRADDMQATRVPSLLLDPLPVDPAVDQALRRLRMAAPGRPGEPRP